MGKIIVRPLIPEIWDDLTKLFGKQGAYWGCWCMYWRLTNKEYNSASRENRMIQLKVINDDPDYVPGLIAYKNGIPVGWCGISPKNKFDRLVKSRLIKPIDDEEVWSIVCFFVHKDHRGNNIISDLIKGCIQFASDKNIRILESYPVKIETKERLTAVSAYYGTLSLFERFGFKMVGDTKARSGRHRRVIVRYYAK